MSNLLDQWNEHIIKGNQLSRELEDFEGIMHVADMTNSMIAIYDGTGTTFIGKVLSPEKMDEIKRVVVSALTEAKLTKEVELEKLMGRKPAYVNPVFEAAVQDMERQRKLKNERKLDPEEILSGILQDEAAKIEDKPVPLKPSEILEAHAAEIEHMYKIQMTTVGSIAEKYGVKKTDVNTFLAKHKLFRTTRKEDGFLDAKVQARQSK